MKKLARTKKAVRLPKFAKTRRKGRIVKPVQARTALREDPVEYATSRPAGQDTPKSSVPAHLLTKAEEGELAKCERIIRQGWQSFVEVGEALVTIRDQRLYRDRYETFEEYYRAEWQYQKSQVYRLMEAAKVVRVLSPIGEKSPGDLPLPTCEAQVRSLAGLRDSEIKSIWRQAAKAAQGKRITARLVLKQVREIALPSSKAAQPARKRRRPNASDASSAIEKALDQLVEIVRGEPGKREAAEKLKRQILRLLGSGTE